MATHRIDIKRLPRVQELQSLLTITPAAAESALSAFDRSFREHERALFSSEGASGGAIWAPLSPKYAARKRRRWPGRRILTATGRLRRSLVQSDPEHVREWHLVGENALLVVGTRDPVAAFHHEGTPRMPKRDPIQMVERQEAAMRASAAKALIPHVTRAIRALFARSA